MCEKDGSSSSGQALFFGVGSRQFIEAAKQSIGDDPKNKYQLLLIVQHLLADRASIDILDAGHDRVDPSHFLSNN